MFWNKKSNENTIHITGNNNIVIRNGEIICDGVSIGSANGYTVVVDGNVENLRCDCSVTVNGHCNDVSCGGSCTVQGDVMTVSAGGSVRCNSVTGNIMCGGSVRKF